MSELSEITEREKLDAEDRWPNWPILPMVGRSPVTRWRMGIVVASRKNVVYECNMFELEAGPLEPQLASLPHHDYPDPDAMLAEWRVD